MNWNERLLVKQVEPFMTTTVKQYRLPYTKETLRQTLLRSDAIIGHPPMPCLYTIVLTHSLTHTLHHAFDSTGKSGRQFPGGFFEIDSFRQDTERRRCRGRRGDQRKRLSRRHDCQEKNRRTQNTQGGNVQNKRRNQTRRTKETRRNHNRATGGGLPHRNPRTHAYRHAGGTHPTTRPFRRRSRRQLDRHGVSGRSRPTLFARRTGKS